MGFIGYTPPFILVQQATGGWVVYAPSSTSTDDLTIKANTTDTYPYIKLNGNEHIDLGVSGANSIRMYSSATNMFNINYSTPDLTLTSTIADKNLFLKTTGTGVVKFGTYTAGAATDSTGYITILDAAGNTRKLMVQA